MNKKHFMTLAVLCGTLCVASFAQAAVIVNTESERPTDPATVGTLYTPTFVAGNPSMTDLLAGIVGVNTSADPGANFEFEGGGGLAALTDGSVETVYGGGTGSSNPRFAYATAGTGGSRNAGTGATWALGGAFDLTEVNVYGGWVDGGRDEQSFSLLVSSDGGTSYTEILPTSGAVGGNLSGNGDTSLGGRSPISHRNSFVDDAGGFIALGVTNVRLDFTSAVENGQTGYTEIDVFGSSVAVPEPSTFGLATIVMTGIAARRRRRA